MDFCASDRSSCQTNTNGSLVSLGSRCARRYVAWTIKVDPRFQRLRSVLLVGRVNRLAGLLQNILRILSQRSRRRQGKKLLIGVRAARRQHDFVGLGIDGGML